MCKITATEAAAIAVKGEENLLRDTISDIYKNIRNCASKGGRRYNFSCCGIGKFVEPISIHFTEDGYSVTKSSTHDCSILLIFRWQFSKPCLLTSPKSVL